MEMARDSNLNGVYAKPVFVRETDAFCNGTFGDPRVRADDGLGRSHV